jgi:hypothetical protein
MDPAGIWLGSGWMLRSPIDCLLLFMGDTVVIKVCKLEYKLSV